ncbi:hypothetical protein CH368_06005 [Leptospira levettii]|nr:hypothetical protein CH368_06005 [Leptospira levettii]
MYKMCKEADTKCKKSHECDCILDTELFIKSSPEIWIETHFWTKMGSYNFTSPAHRTETLQKVLIETLERFKGVGHFRYFRYNRFSDELQPLIRDYCIRNWPMENKVRQIA